MEVVLPRSARRIIVLEMRYQFRQVNDMESVTYADDPALIITACSEEGLEGKESEAFTATVD